MDSHRVRLPDEFVQHVVSGETGRPSGPVFQLAPRDTKWRRLDGFRDLSIGEAIEKCTSSEPVVLSVGSGPAVFALASEARAFGLTVAVGPAEELQFD